MFFVNQATEGECLYGSIGGLPAGSRVLAESVAGGDAVFVYNTSSKVMHGPFEAERAGGWKLEPQAFGGNYPAQVLFRERRGRVAVSVPLAAVAHALTFFDGGKFTQRLSTQQVAALHAVFDDAGALQTDDRSGRRSDAGDARRVRVERRRDEAAESLRVVVTTRNPRRSPRRSPRRERGRDSRSPERPSRHAKRPAPEEEVVPSSSARPRRAERSPPRKAEPAPAPPRSYAPLEVRYDRKGAGFAAAQQPAAYALDEFVPLPTGSPVRSPSPQPPRAATALAVRPALGGSVLPELLLREPPDLRDEEPQAGAEEQGTYRQYMLREALRPVRSELAAIRTIHSSGEERARATRHLLAKYHPSQAGAVVQNPALQWLYSEITKVITQALS